MKKKMKKICKIRIYATVYLAVSKIAVFDTVCDKPVGDIFWTGEIMDFSNDETLGAGVLKNKPVANRFGYSDLVR